MGFVENFLKDHGEFSTSHFHPPVCWDLEPNYQRVLEEGERNAFGVYVVADTFVIAEVKEVEIVGLSGQYPDGKYSTRGKVLIKNPYNSKAQEKRYGVRNAILLDGDTGIVFAGRHPDEDLVRVIRPVIASHQDIFRAELQRDVYDSRMLPKIS